MVFLLNIAVQLPAGVIATEFVSKATPDGYTLLLSSSTTHGISPVLYKKLPYDAMKDFTARPNQRRQVARARRG